MTTLGHMDFWLFFFIGLMITHVIDFIDHTGSLSTKIKAAVSEQKGMTRVGYFHTWRFTAILLGLAIGWTVHMVQDGY